MLEKVRKFIEEFHMIEKNDHVIAGVSGGADSVCLLLLLSKLREELQFSLRVIHVEHGIRGGESRRDAAFTEALCKKTDVEYQCFSVDAVRMAEEEKCSLEEAARILRYEILQREAGKWNAKIAVAHHQEDDAETILFHLIRGSGLQGLCGIAPVRGSLIRPLLHVKKCEILDYLRQQDQEYCTDSSNADIAYSRNKIRLQVMPVLTEINGQAAAHMQKTADIIKEAVEFLGRQAEEAEISCTEKTEQGIRIRESEFMRQDPVIRKELLRRVFYRLTDRGKDIGTVHLEAVEDLFQKQTGRKIHLPYGLEGRRVYAGVELLSADETAGGEKPVFCFSKEVLEQAGEEGIRCGPFRLRIMENTGLLEKIPQKTYTKWLNYDMIKSNLLARTRQEGDYFVCSEKGEQQKLKRYFVNEKIEAGERERIWLLAEGSHILWIVGYRISARYKINEDTKKILEVRFDGGKENDGIGSGINS